MAVAAVVVATAVALGLLVALVLPAESAKTPVIVEAPDVQYEFLDISPKIISPQVYLLTFLEDGDTDFCSGVILDSRHVLSSAYCVARPQLKSQVVTETGTRLKPSSATFNVVEEIFYEKKPTENAGADIVILRVDRPMFTNPDTVPLFPLQTQSYYRTKNCVLGGWNAEERPDVRGGRVAAPPAAPLWTLKSVQRRRCVESNDKRTPPDDLLCIGAHKRNRDTCQEDPGAPVVCDGKLTGVVAGIRGCGIMSHASLYTDVGYYARWIEEALRRDAQQEESGERLQRWRMDSILAPPPKRRSMHEAPPAAAAAAAAAL